MFDKTANLDIKIQPFYAIACTDCQSDYPEEWVPNLSLGFYPIYQDSKEINAEILRIALGAAQSHALSRTEGDKVAVLKVTESGMTLIEMFYGCKEY